MKLASFLIPVTLALLTFVSCSKSGSGSKPQIKIESITSTVQPGENLDVKFTFNTNGGTLSGGGFVAIRIRQNQIPPQNSISGDTVLTQIPTFSGVNKGEFEYTQPYNGYLHFDDHINDTLLFKFAAISTAGVSSDTITAQVVSISQ
jgi:hypothetical protein